MDTHGIDQSIRIEVVVEAALKEVWEVWTTKAGLESFFAPVCEVELRVNGAFEILFDPDGEPGYRGAEGMRVMAYQPEKMLAFTWNAPPHLPEARKQLTHVQVWMETLGDERTRVMLAHRGWGEGGEWNEAFNYFERAWGEVVMPRMQYRFSTGPLDWEKPPFTLAGGT